MLTCLVILILLFLAIICFCYFRAFYSPVPRRENPYVLPSGQQYQEKRDEMLELIRNFDAIEYEDVFISSKDGLRLFGRYYHLQDNAPIHIQMHGYRGTAIRDFCGGSKLAREEGHNLLVVDQRSHGASQGHTICFGIKECEDCICWVNYLIQRFGKDTPIILSGVSMGAATVIMAAGKELPKNVKGVIADCPYSSPYKIIQKVSADMGLPPVLTMPFIKIAARLIGRFDLESFSPELAAQKIKIPVLLIHGEADRFVPCSMSRDLAAGSDYIQLETFPNAGHGLSFIVDFERYKQLSHDFLNSIL